MEDFDGQVNLKILGSLMLPKGAVEAPSALMAELEDKGYYVPVSVTRLDRPNELFFRVGGRDVIGERAIRAHFGIDSPDNEASQ